jgi:hypothetical protein
VKPPGPVPAQDRLHGAVAQPAFAVVEHERKYGGPVRARRLRDRARRGLREPASVFLGSGCVSPCGGDRGSAPGGVGRGRTLRAWGRGPRWVRGGGGSDHRQGRGRSIG